LWLESSGNLYVKLNPEAEGGVHLGDDDVRRLTEALDDAPGVATMNTLIHSVKIGHLARWEMIDGGCWRRS